jgi:hypothetical protein
VIGASRWESAMHDGRRDPAHLARVGGKVARTQTDGSPSRRHTGGMARRSHLPVVGIVALVAAAACDNYACRWTDEPMPDPVELDRAYATDDGMFEVVLQADGAWPPVAGTTSLTIEWVRPDPDPPVGPRLYVERPFEFDGDLVAPTDPVVVELEPGQWRVDGLALTAEGLWAVPVTLEQDGVDDSIDLYIEVVADAE